jgi:expansin (peptidoglycan-binding protein)
VRRLLTLLFVGLVPLLACGADEDGEDGSGGGGGRPLSSNPSDGVATFYNADGAGNCGFDKSPADLDVTAIAMPEYNGSASCGACIRVQGPNGDVTVRVVDSCPDCANKGINLDLSAQAFAKIADPKKGRISISYQLVSCATSGSIAYHFKEGSSKYWTAIQIRNHRVPIGKVEYQKQGSWVAMTRADYNYFLETKGVGDQPNGLSLRVTATDGQVIEDTLAQGVQAATTVTGTKQFE